VDMLFKCAPTIDGLARLVSTRVTLWQKDKAFSYYVMKRLKLRPKSPVTRRNPEKHPS